MSLELIPVPIKVTVKTLTYLRAEAEITGRHQNDIAREVLDAWADKQAHATTVRIKHAKRAELDGTDGNVTK